jgi:hypothetical protein
MPYSRFVTHDCAKMYPEFAPFFEGHELKFQTGLSGNAVDPEGRVIIGDGPFTLPDVYGDRTPLVRKNYLAHEMAHFVEINERRCSTYNWGLKVPRVVVLGQECVEPRTTQIIERELRVHAFQFNLLEKLGLLDDELLNWVVKSLIGGTVDYYRIPGKTEEARIRWGLRMLARYRKTHTYGRFEFEWWRRNEVLKARAKRRARKLAKSLEIAHGV